MNEEKNLIDVNEAGHIVLDMISSTEFDNILKNCVIQTDDFKQGAIFGASMAMSFINTKATKYSTLFKIIGLNYTIFQYIIKFC